MFEKMYLHFEVPFECHSLDLSSVLIATLKPVTRPRCWMPNGIENSRLWAKLVGLLWGREGNRICVFVRFRNKASERCRYFLCLS